MTTLSERLMGIYERLTGRYGPQHWWPGDSWFEIMAGAVLTQGVAWANVRRAISNLASAGALSPDAIRDLTDDEVATLIFPSGYFNSKARKLKALSDYLGHRFDDDIETMARMDLGTLRGELLSVYGIGYETADSILLYAVGKPVFVIDNYTTRLFSRLGLAERGSYMKYQSLFMDNLPHDPALFGEYHALIVRHSREVCKKSPLCYNCFLLDICATGKATGA